jgi:hypothetical protein
MKKRKAHFLGENYVEFKTSKCKWYKNGKIHILYIELKYSISKIN